MSMTSRDEALRAVEKKMRAHIGTPELIPYADRLAALLATASEQAPVAYIEGNQYLTQGGVLVRFVKTHNAGTSYETMEDEDGVNRYTRRDFGRVTASAHDYSDPRNTPPLYTSPAHTSEARDAEVEAVKSALDRAYWLGQEYWRLADSQSYSDNRRSDETRSRYNQLVIDTLAAMRQEAE